LRNGRRRHRRACLFGALIGTVLITFYLLLLGDEDAFVEIVLLAPLGAIAGSMVASILVDPGERD
jgi:hypothetical protein